MRVLATSLFLYGRKPRTKRQSNWGGRKNFNISTMLGWRRSIFLVDGQLHRHKRKRKVAVACDQGMAD